MALTQRQKNARAVLDALIRSARQTWTAESGSRWDDDGNRIIYTQILHPDGKLSCDCMSWTRKTGGKRWCSHLGYRAAIEGWMEVRKEGEFYYVKDV